MDSKLGLVVYLNIFMLIGSVFGQLPRSNRYDEITNALTSVAEECGDREAGSQAGRCFRDTMVDTSEPFVAKQNVEALQTLSNCLQPFKQLVTRCGKDNYVAILESLYVAAQNDAELIKKFTENQISVRKLQCSSEELTKANRIAINCLEKKFGTRGYGFGVRTFFDKFCWYASGYRVCIQEVHDAFSPNEHCPRVHAEMLAYLGAFASIENGAENSTAVNRCFNTAEE